MERDHSPVVDLTSGTVPGDTFVDVLLDYLSLELTLHTDPPHELQRFLCDNPCTPRPSATRLHSGWVVSQVDAGLPLGLLLEITGFTAAQSLQRYLK